MERLDRGVVAVRSGTNFISWRFLGSDDPATTFDVVCDGTVVKEGLTVTNFKHYSGKLTSKYQVVAKVGGQVVDTSSEVGVWDKYLSLQLSQPAAGSGYSYTPNDMSVGDIDADGQYELFVKWDPTNSKDNSEDGVTGNVFIDCYRLDGTFLWRIDLAPAQRTARVSMSTRLLTTQRSRPPTTRKAGSPAADVWTADTNT